MNNIKKIGIIIYLTIMMGVFAVPSVSFSAQGISNFTGPIIVDCTGGNSIASGGHECGWSDLIKQVNKVINFLFYLSIILATIAFIWCGILFLTAGGDVGKAKEAKEIFFKVVVGFIWIFAAWLIVHFITTAFGLKQNISILDNPSH